MLQAAQTLKQQNRAISAAAAGQGSFTIESGQASSTFTPANVDDIELAPAPVVTGQISTSGQTLLTASGLINVACTSTAAMIGIIYFTYTPEGGIATAPVQIAQLGLGSTAPSAQTSCNVTGVRVVTGIPVGLVQFNLWCESRHVLGASFDALEVTIQPL